MKFVAGVNQLAAADSLSRQMADRLLTALRKMTGVLGLRVIEADWAEKGEIEELIKERARLREAKKFREADELRKKLLEDRSVELMDHRARTVWVKRERPAAG
ncbi:MAG TPA: hypothetical protein VH621_00405 [Nitrososphaera sp.]